MSNEVKFNIRLLVNGKEKIVEATTNVKHFAEEFEKAKNASTRLRDKLLEFNQTAQSFQNLASGIQQLSGALGVFTQGYADQEAAETRLANNMRNTMDAREEDIQSIKDLCAAQQQLGVIGDEVQLAGAQELATYLTMKDGLQTLIPVMNDMLAQQYGLNATQEQAQTIASMLGKVMDGQVGALSRYGYKFDEAQEKILKYGTEQQRVAVLAEVVTSAVGGSNEALRQTPSGEVKALANWFGDLKEQIGSATVYLQGYLNLSAQIGMGISGIANLATGFAGVAVRVRGLTTSLRAGIVASTTFRTSSASLSAMLTVLRSAFTGATIGATTLKVAIRGLMAATGVGLAIVALTWALEKLFFSSEETADGMDDVSEASQRLQQQVEAEKSAYSNARVEMDKEIQKLDELIKSKGNTAGAVQELNNKYGEAFGYHKTASEWYKTLTENSETYCRQLGLEAKMKVLAAQGADIDFDLEKNRREQERLKKEGKATETGTTTVMTNQFGFQVGGGQSYTRDTKEMAALKEQEGKLKKAQEENEKDLNIASNMMADLSKNIKTTPTGGSGSGSGSGSGTGNNNEPKKLELIENPKSMADLKNNVQYYEQAVDKADKTDRENIRTLVEKREAAKALVEAYEEEQAAMSSPIEAGSVDWYETRLRELSKEIRSTGNESVVADLQSDYKAIEEEFKNFKIRVGLEVQEPDELAEPEITVREAKRQDNDLLSQKARLIQQDYEIGIIGKDEALAAIASINMELERLGMEPIEIPVMTEDIDKARKKFDLATDSVASMGQSLSGLGNALELPELNIAGTIAQAIATMTQGYANATLQAKELGPIGWLAFAATGLAQLVAMISTVKSVTAFAQGGIVSGPTMALVGEYAGASNNPEVIAPLDKLRSMLQPQGGVSGTVRFVIEGRKLVGVIDNEKKLSRRN